MTNDELLPWLEKGTIDALISVAVFRQHSPKNSKDYDRARELDFQAMAQKAYTHHIGPAIPHERWWPDIEIARTIQQIWQLGYIEEAMAIKSALAQAGVTL